LIPIARKNDSNITLEVTDLITTLMEFLPEKSTKLRKICENILLDNNDSSKNFILNLFDGCCSRDSVYIYKTIGDIFLAIAIEEIRKRECPYKLKSIFNSIRFCIGVDKNNFKSFYQILEELLSIINRFESVSIFIGKNILLSFS